MSIIWFAMIIFGMVMAIISGRIEIINAVILQDAQEAVVFAIGLTGIMAVWLGLMNIAEKSGLIDSFAVLMRPISKLLFPSVPPNHPAISAIMMNMVANMFGAGNSATALGIKAMEELQTLNKNKKTATNAMCMFLVINMSSIQLIPLTVLKIRADAGSQIPTEIITTSLIATTVSTFFGILACKILEGKKR
ncbi:nucleoside recognition domain-containing protein [Clostridium formicaceticum]|uniref:Spore maturation protein n=1 Tax=Clostridium formicaceticum TaxID=1497 RepID=A0AAC9WFC4_9CLOT|nr:nucleoside recognition domain-containing protein [Clostridium formicaceticum]AOY75483.1 spore maturation protein [Clostridium formicaceticum]ARE85770.1 Spore maturation protein A [Clostridium formicaceticum]